MESLPHSESTTELAWRESVLAAATDQEREAARRYPEVVESVFEKFRGEVDDRDLFRSVVFRLSIVSRAIPEVPEEFDRLVTGSVERDLVQHKAVAQKN